jgi:hypothetical protein
MTQPWWPEGAQPPAGSPQPNQAPWAPPPQVRATGQNYQAGQNRPIPPDQPAPWMPGQPPPTTQGTAAAPTAVVNPVQDGTPVQGGPPPRPTVPGLGFVNVLLVLATLAFAGFFLLPWVVDWAGGVEPCLDGGGAWGCVINDASREQVLLPLVAIFAAFCLARGAGIERMQGRAIGWVYVLLGFGALLAAWAVGS